MSCQLRPGIEYSLPLVAVISSTLQFPMRIWSVRSPEFVSIASSRMCERIHHPTILYHPVDDLLW